MSEPEKRSTIKKGHRNCQTNGPGGALVRLLQKLLSPTLLRAESFIRHTRNRCIQQESGHWSINARDLEDGIQIQRDIEISSVGSRWRQCCARRGSLSLNDVQKKGGHWDVVHRSGWFSEQRIGRALGSVVVASAVAGDPSWAILMALWSKDLKRACGKRPVNAGWSGGRSSSADKSMSRRSSSSAREEV